MYETMNVLAALLCYVVISFQGIGAIYFTRTNYKFCINAPGGHVVGQIQAVLNVTDTCTKDDLQYFIFSQLPVPFEVGKDGVISVSNTSAIKTDTPFVLALRASCMGHSAAVPVTVFAKERGECPCQQNVQDTPTQTMCFQHPVIHLHVEENQKNMSFGPLSDCQLGSSSVLDREYRVTEGSYEGKPWTETFFVDAKSGNITLLGALDREKSEDISLKMICFLFKDGVVIRNDTAEVKIKIGDVNDNMIFLHLGGKKLRNANVTIPSSKSDASIVLEDADSFDCSTHRVEVVLDPKDACTGNIVTDTIIGPPLSPVKHVCQLSVQTDRSKLLGKVEPYRCQIAIIDPTYIITKGEERSVSNQQSILDVIIDIERDIVLDARKDIFIEAEVPKAAPKLTRVAQLPLSLTNNNYYVIEKQQGKAISVTLKSGIVYVDDASKLTEPVHNVTVARIDKEKKYFHIVVKVKRTLLRDNENCSISCSRFKSKKACESSCGIGATAGRCTWRGHFRSGQMTSGYETCTYSDNKCPDQECDDLEKIYPALCPQDCTNKTTGPIVLKVDKIGIKSAAAPVYCDYNFHCHIIFMDEAHQSLTSANEGVTLPNITEIDTNHSLGLLTSQDWQRAEIHEGGLETCDVNCRTTIAATIGCLGAVICLFVLAWKLRRLKCHSGQRLQKHVGSSVSVSAVPSDYQDDRELQRTLHNSPQWVPKGPLEYTQMPEDLKWEFERENLVLEKTIGEGEFGKVMKAKASNIDGKDGVKDVAVKMLKDCASGAELRDLLSEYSLLRDVNHPNVVRLLGACTKNGPVYIIVEYCEHGSLLHFMRRSRLEENGYVNQRMRHREMIRNNTSGEWIEPELLTMGDLLSFAWQIAKGMKYLSEIKLVHRDLAARNVLVASGKILKISDFGLTRDVYEADTYLKQSKGRIPVKWLAPESLYAQIYTTQSDVWSYGIVLWEIVTLGAPPYPGIPPERLYSLLVAGYRMDKPDHCTDELYAVMQKCWKIEQQERPTFALLVDIVDRLLQQRTEYLDLMTGGTDDTRPEFYDKCFGNTEVQDKNPSIANTQVQSVAKNGISVISGDIEPYLIPISRRDLCPQIGSSDQTINGQVDSVVKNASNKCLDFTQKPSSGEQLSLLFDSGTARFSPSSDNEDDWESRETDVLPVI